MVFSAELVPAMVTPFRADGSVDFEKAEKLAQYLVANGCDGILVNGTTGEGPTLTWDEKLDLVRCVKKAVPGHPLMAGAGNNDTYKSVEEAKKMAALGVDALLVVVPYYNKPSQAGMIAHFTAVAQAVPDTEIVIYNIPGRTGVQMIADTMAALHATCPNIIGVKQSFPDMDAVSDITAKLPRATWKTWCGDDSLTLPMMALGAHGTISVLAHLTGPMLRELIQSVKQQNLTKALDLHLKMLNPAKELFFLPNPTVVKTCLARLGLVGPTLRLPMVPPNDAEMKRIDALLETVKPLLPQAVR
jgi:4-hydroxy-tetrahydrodipicolinate synthase